MNVSGSHCVTLLCQHDVGTEYVCAVHSERRW